MTRWQQLMATADEAHAWTLRKGIEEALAQSGGNRTRAAKLLGMNRSNLRRYIRELKIESPNETCPNCDGTGRMGG